MENQACLTKGIVKGIITINILRILLCSGPTFFQVLEIYILHKHNYYNLKQAK